MTTAPTVQLIAGAHVRRGRGRGSLALRISVLVTVSCVITAVVAGTLAVNLIRRSNLDAAQKTLAGLADAAQATSDIGTPQVGQLRARRTLRALKIEFVAVAANGSVSAGSKLSAASVSSSDVLKVLAGQDVSARRRVNGQSVVVEGRGTRAGGLVLVQRQADATAGGETAIRRVLLGLVIGTAIAIVLGLAVARRIASPLRRTAAAAHTLASGRRDVEVPIRGPSEVAEVGEAVNILAAALMHSEERQRDFLLSVSHDLRTPLTAIRGYAESLADGVIPESDTAQVGSVLVTEAERLNRLVNDLLDLARLDADQFRLDFGVVDLGELANGAGRVWASRCSAAGVIFRAESGAGPIMAWTDPSRLRQVLDGLFENALRVTPSGEPIVLAAWQADAGTVVIEVRDGGPGLADEDLAVAFERSVLYERYRGVRQVGTGLGLAIVHGLVGRLGGTIEAGHSTEGGARFTVRLPAASPASSGNTASSW